MNIAFKCLVVSCLTLCSFAAAGDDNRRSQPVLMFTAGTLNVGVGQFQFSSGMFEPVSIIDEMSLGSLGRAKLKTLSQVITENGVPVVPDPAECPDGFPIPLVTTDDATVLTFRNLSQLMGSSRTIVCIDPISGSQGVRGDGRWTGGTHRFANVTGGEFHVSSTATPQSTNGQFYSTVGSLSGRIERR